MGTDSKNNMPALEQSKEPVARSTRKAVVLRFGPEVLRHIFEDYVQRLRNPARQGGRGKIEEHATITVLLPGMSVSIFWHSLYRSKY